MGQRRHRRQTLYSSSAPETVKSRQKSQDVQEKICPPWKGVLVTGRAIGQKDWLRQSQDCVTVLNRCILVQGRHHVTDMTDLTGNRS